MWHMNDGHFWGMHWAWWMLWIAFLFWIFAVPWGLRGQRTKKDSPYDILKKRFARGEISKEEYLEMKKILADNE
jgi:putative membrane protein